MESLLIIFLLLGPILDVGAYYNLPVNILVRGIYLLIIIVLLIKDKKNIKLLSTLLIFSIIQILFQKVYLNFSLSDAISNVFKFLYLPVSILYLKDYSFKKYKKEKILSIIIFTYIGLYLFSYITRIGGNAYLETDGKSGFKGLFSSINEFSAIIVGLLPIVTIYLKERKQKLLLFMIIILSLICSLLVGTKVLLAGTIITVMYLLFQERDNLFIRKSLIKKILIISFSIIIVLIGILLFTKTRTYQNMTVQQDFFKANNFYDYLNHVVFNDRLSFVVNNFNYYKSTNIFKYLFGIGINNYSVKMVEIDLFDILFRYGIIGICLFIFTLRKIPFNKLKQEEKFSFVLLILISLTSGHVLIYPNVCIYIGLITSRNN